nr:PREDICTED: transmembrane protein C9orf91 homolog isoform X1 [Struthio camelus australis]XP_009666455.1 PREDICTED: transmembrane protein C9orf91 homolog isoform X1 [Struthio camelus australis]XP_009666456.1 PREDICTED: transmembrane protein C9orf91 homolog isoform X1 [Struthio camelus australis]XP_009666457.1 PREDICTED: transmembrane protein C9orf91 homolog isoform X1 [Struthio camelus australis]XP_009666458.1 PREDICTED: transmembrane protein C9orf91 homolog isoform X1 [Struthio camelus austra
MAYKSQAGGIEKNSSLSSIFYCKSDLNEGSLQWTKEPPNGQVLMVLSVDNNCSATSFDMELCAEKLKSFGVQVAVDPWRKLIQDAVLKPKVRRYMFYNSRAFQIAIAVIFYISLWTNIYSTVQLYSFRRYWEASVLVTVAAVAVTVVVILIINRRQRKINVNTDVRLAAVNEIFIKHSLILGITDVLDGPHNALQLWFVHFNPERCLQSLSAHLADLRRKRESDLRHSLDQLCVVMETAVQPDPGKVEQVSSEESPLLSNGVNLKEPMTCNELLCLIPEGPPEVMAQQLLVIFSGCYVRLLVSGQLPQAMAAGHMEHRKVPCLCQFIETSALNTRQCWFTGR